MECQLWYLPVGSVALPAFLSRRKLSPSSAIDARHFSPSKYDTAVFQAATLVVELRVTESESVGMWVLLEELLGIVAVQN